MKTSTNTASKLLKAASEPALVNQLITATDEELAHLVKTGQTTALEQLYDRYFRRAMTLAFRILGQTELAEEVVQEAFLKFWQQPELYQAERSRFATWFLSVVHHRAINERKRSSLRLTVSVDASISSGIAQSEGELTLGSLLYDQSKPDLHEEVWLRLQSEQVRAALQRLSLDQRRAIELAYFEGMNQREIAQKLGEPLGTIKTRIRSGLQKLKVGLEAQEVAQGKIAPSL